MRFLDMNGFHVTLAALKAEAAGKGWNPSHALGSASADPTKVEPGLRFPCPHPGCSKTFSLKTNMRRHLRSVHGIGGHKHVCPTCSPLFHA